MLIIVTKYFTWSDAELSVFSSLQSVLIKSVVLYHKNVYSAVNVPLSPEGVNMSSKQI